MKPNVKSLLLLCLCLISFDGGLLAQESQGVGEVQCGAFNKKKAYLEARELATISAINNWMQQNRSNYNNFKRVEKEIYENLKNYSLTPPRVQTYRNKELGTCGAEVVVDLNVLELRRAFLSDTQATTKTGLTFVFVAREKDEVSNRSESTTGTRKEVVREMSRESGATSETNRRSEERTESKIEGNRRSNEQATWRTESVKEIDATVKEEFILAGYKVAEQSALIAASGNQFNPNEIKLGFNESGDIDPTVINSAINGLKGIESSPVEYLAVAALDVDLPTKNPTNNNYSVSVVVNGKVFNIKDGAFFTSGVCNVLGIGEGANIVTAKFNALEKAAQECASNMVGQLSGSGIR